MHSINPEDLVNWRKNKHVQLLNFTFKFNFIGAEAPGSLLDKPTVAPDDANPEIRNMFFLYLPSFWLCKATETSTYCVLTCFQLIFGSQMFWLVFSQQNQFLMLFYYEVMTHLPDHGCPQASSADSGMENFALELLSHTSYFVKLTMHWEWERLLLDIRWVWPVLYESVSQSYNFISGLFSPSMWGW